MAERKSSAMQAAMFTGNKYATVEMAESYTDTLKQSLKEEGGAGSPNQNHTFSLHSCWWIHFINDDAFLSLTQNNQCRHRQYWPCVYLVSIDARFRSIGLPSRLAAAQVKRYDVDSADDRGSFDAEQRLISRVKLLTCHIKAWPFWNEVLILSVGPLVSV